VPGKTSINMRRMSVITFRDRAVMNQSYGDRTQCEHAGELIRIIDRGTSSMRVLLETMLFSIGPAMIDVLGAALYLSAKEAWMATIVLVSVVCYVPVTIVITELRGKLRRNLNTLDNRKSAKVRYTNG
jgi:ABC-type transport system involved in Fe-S cluster assembly fused permease/ATPase subunit